MRNVPKKNPPREIPPAFPPELETELCGFCGSPIVWCRDGRPSGRAPLAAVDLADTWTHGGVAMQRTMIVGDPPIAFDTNMRTRFRWHADHCKRQQSFTGQARARKVRP